jgi:hypothetical protein
LFLLVAEEEGVAEAAVAEAVLYLLLEMTIMKYSNSHKALLVI